MPAKPAVMKLHSSLSLLFLLFTQLEGSEEETADASVEYEYYLSEENQIPDNEMKIYSWHYDDFSECSVTCDTGMWSNCKYVLCSTSTTYLQTLCSINTVLILVM